MKIKRLISIVLSTLLLFANAVPSFAVNDSELTVANLIQPRYTNIGTLDVELQKDGTSLEGSGMGIITGNSSGKIKLYIQKLNGSQWVTVKSKEKILISGIRGSVDLSYSPTTTGTYRAKICIEVLNNGIIIESAEEISNTIKI